MSCPHARFEAAGRLGLDAVAVTEHSTHYGAFLAYEMGLEAAFTVFRGVEVYTKSGDMLGFGVSAEMKPDMDFQELLEAVKAEAGGQWKVDIEAPSRAGAGCFGGDAR